MNQKLFGNYLKEARINAGYKDREELSKISGVWNSTIKRMEDGITKSPSIEVLKKLAPALKVSIEELMEKAGYIKGQTAIPKNEQRSNKLTRKIIDIVDEKNIKLEEGEEEIFLKAIELIINGLKKNRKAEIYKEREFCFKI